MKTRTIALFCVTYFFYYWTRYNYPVALPFLKEEFNLSMADLGWIATALTLGYALGQLVNGVLVDRRGPRLMMTIGGVGVVLANLVMGGNVIVPLFAIAWLANGYFQAMGYPATLKLIVNWFRPEERGRALSYSEFAQSLASVLILPFAGFLAGQISWRMVFTVPALLMAVVTIWFWMQAKDTPNGTTELSESNLGQDFLSRYRQAFGNWRLASAYLSYGACQFVRYAMITWIPLYLFTVTGLPIFQAALASMSFQIGGALGSLLVGWLADWSPFVSRRWMLIAGGMIGSGLAAIGLGMLPASNVWPIVFTLAACGVGIEALEVAYFLTPTDFLSERLTATGVGCMNATGKLIASLQGVVIGGIIGSLGYGIAFYVAAGFAFLAAILILPLSGGGK